MEILVGIAAFLVIMTVIAIVDVYSTGSAMTLCGMIALIIYLHMEYVK